MLMRNLSQLNVTCCVIKYIRLILKQALNCIDKWQNHVENHGQFSLWDQELLSGHINDLNVVFEACQV